MMDKNKILVVICIAITAIIFVVFGVGFSEGLEGTIIVVLGLLSIIAIVIGFNSKKETQQKLIVMGVLGVIVSIGLVVWSDSNSSSRRKKELEAMHEKNKAQWAEQEREDSIQKVRDSIQHRKDSINNVAESKKLYEKEGDTIFGKFLFGMSKKDFEKIVSTIKRETHGVISISGYDFEIYDSKFYNNKLYSLTLSKVNHWTRYYYHDAHEYETDNDGSEIVNAIKESFSKKYGTPNNSWGQWNFSHKHIYVRAGVWYKSREGLLSTETWTVFISFTDPITENVVDKERQEEANKKEEERKAAEEALKKKKESFGGGL